MVSLATFTKDAVPVTDFDPYAEEVLIDPYPYYEQLREAGPVVLLERYGAYADRKSVV
mgnify:CR=1 FL=1